MLFTLYDFNTPKDKELFRKKVSNFILSCTEYKYEMMEDDNRISVTFYQLQMGYSALQLIHTLDTIIDNNDIACCLVQFCYTDPLISKRYDKRI